MRSSFFSLPLATLLLVGAGCAGSNSQMAASAAPAKPLTQAERDAAVKDLEQTKQAFLNSIKGLSPAQYTYKPAPDRWSVAEVAEHIIVAEERISGLLKDKILASPTPPKLLSQVSHDDSKLHDMVVDRSHKVQAPEMLKPTGRFPTLEAATAGFEERRQKTLDYVQNTQDDLRGHAAPHPILKALDGYQWLLLTSAHCARHTAQIEEVKADPNFPKS